MNIKTDADTLASTEYVSFFCFAADSAEEKC